MWFVVKFSGGQKSAGRARVFQGPEKKQRYNRARKIILRMKMGPKNRYEIRNLEYNILHSLRHPHHMPMDWEILRI